MGSRWILGITAGLAASGLSIASNLRRGDPHLVSAGPDLVAAIVVAALIYNAVRQSGASPSHGAGRGAGMLATLLASGICAVTMAAFTWFYLPIHSLTLAAYAAGVSFVLVYVVGYIATRRDVRSNVRLHQTAAGSFRGSFTACRRPPQVSHISLARTE
jgi:hypothetical protein